MHSFVRFVHTNSKRDCKDCYFCVPVGYTYGLMHRSGTEMDMLLATLNMLDGGGGKAEQKGKWRYSKSLNLEGNRWLHGQLSRKQVCVITGMEEKMHIS